MPFYEYKVVPAPERSPKVKGLKGPAKFAHALETLMNGLAQEGWEYQRAESLPEEEKKGLMGGREIVTRTVLVFRRELYFEENTEENLGSAPPREAPAPALSLARTTSPEVARAEELARAEADAAADMDDIYRGAEPEPGAEPGTGPGTGPGDTAPARRPLVADRKGQGVDF